MKNMLLACAAACALSGCTWADNLADSTAAFINRPSVQVIAVTVKTASTAVICGIDSLSGFSSGVEAGLASAKVTDPKDLAKAQQYTEAVYAISDPVCKKLSGVTVAAASNVPAVTAVQ